MLNPKEKCAVFLDIDGTLLHNSFIIPQRNIDAINAARAKGHMVFINTGRSWANIPPVLMEQIEKFDGIVAGSGAMVTIGGKTEFQASMSKETLKKFVEYAFEHREFWYIFEGLKNVYILPNGNRKHADFQILLQKTEDYLLMCDDEIQVVAMGKTVSEDFKELFKDELTVFQFDTYADIVVKGLNKAVGIEKVLELTGIKRENTIAMGDSNNDYDMLTYAGIGVAMANSQQSILDIADYVTASNAECGVAAAIEKFLL